jgi:hypothetical protein
MTAQMKLTAQMKRASPANQFTAGAGFPSAPGDVIKVSRSLAVRWSVRGKHRLLSMAWLEAYLS